MKEPAAGRENAATDLLATPTQREAAKGSALDVYRWTSGRIELHGRLLSLLEQRVENKSTERRSVSLATRSAAQSGCQLPPSAAHRIRGGSTAARSRSPRKNGTAPPRQRSTVDQLRMTDHAQGEDWTANPDR